MGTNSHRVGLHPYPEMRFRLTKNRHFQFLFILKVWDIGVSMQKKEKTFNDKILFCDIFKIDGSVAISGKIFNFFYLNNCCVSCLPLCSGIGKLFGKVIWTGRI